MRKKIIERFDKTLDIRSFVNVYTNLSLLLQLLLTQNQTFLFQHHRARSISGASSSSSDKSASENFKDNRLPKLKLAMKEDSSSLKYRLSQMLNEPILSNLD